MTRADEETRAVLQHLVTDQKTHSEQIARLVLDLGGSPNRGQRRDLTPLNDLALGFLLQRIIECQEQDIGTIEECLNDLTEHAEASALAQEALGMAKGHLESLAELAQAATSAA
jgi:predicted outer membrane protein